MGHHADMTVEQLGAIEQDDHLHDKGFPVFNPMSFRPYSWSTYKTDRKQILREVLAGVTVAFAQVPESVAFAFIAGVTPGQALHAAWMIALVVSLFGSRPGLVSGATGAHAAVLAAPLVELGLGVLPYIVIISGALTIVLGLLGVAKFVRLIPLTAMQGFTNGLAIIIAIAQWHSFEVSALEAGMHLDNPDSVFMNCQEKDFIGCRTDGVATVLFMVLWLVITILIVHFFPRLTKMIPSAFVAMAMGLVMEQILRAASSYKTPVIGEVVDVAAGLPQGFWATTPLTPMTWDLAGKLVLPCLIYTAVTLVELLLTMEVVRDETETPNINPNQTVLATGFALIMAGIIGSKGGGATIGLTIINIRSGSNGRYRISGVVGAICIFLITAVASDVISLVPTASLVGVMVIVVVHTFNWGSIAIVLSAILPQCLRHSSLISLRRKINRIDALVIVVVTVWTLLYDLASAVLIGVVISTTVFAWQSSTKLSVEDDVFYDTTRATKRKVYMLNGPLFFGTAEPLMHFFHPRADPDEVEIHLQRSFVFDYSAVEALNELGAKYKALGKKLHVKNMCVGSTKLVRKMDDLIEHFEYHVNEVVDDEDEPLQEPMGLNVTGHGLLKSFDPVG